MFLSWSHPSNFFKVLSFFNENNSFTTFYFTMVQINVSSALVFAVVALNSVSTMAAPTFGHSEVSHQTHHRNHVLVYHSRPKLAGRTVKLPGSGLTNHRTPQGPLRLNHGPVVTHPNHHRTILARKIPVFPGLTHHHMPQGPLRLNHGPVRLNHGPVVKTNPIVARDLEFEVRDFDDELEIRNVDDIEARAVHPKSHSKPLHTWHKIPFTRAQAGVDVNAPGCC
ncbi:hypothetical protein C8J56DRAFT_1056809 [Mycena floridula]|nr:hypothetical protein C8J56DRAFT_1056809 [Mycena floridula]